MSRKKKTGREELRGRGHEIIREGECRGADDIVKNRGLMQHSEKKRRNTRKRKINKFYKEENSWARLHHEMNFKKGKQIKKKYERKERETERQ